MKKRYGGDGYLKEFPELQKWMNTCICCGAKGYSPEMPEKITGRDSHGEYATIKAEAIRHYFSPLKVNELSMCEVCERLVKK